MVKHDDRAIDAVQATITTLRRSLNVSIYLLLPFNESRASFTEEEKEKVSFTQQEADIYRQNAI